MKHISGRVLSVVLVIIAVLWCAIFLLFRRPWVDDTLYFWGGLGFGAASLLIAAIVAFIIPGGSKDTTEITMLPDCATICYALFGVVFNAVFVIRQDGFFGQVLIVGNVLALLVYAVVLYALSRYANRVDATATIISEKISQFDKIKDCIPALLSQTRDADIKKEILALKRTIESGHNMAQKATREEEIALYEQMQRLQQMMQSSTDKDAILKQIAAAKQTATLRNSKLH